MTDTLSAYNPSWRERLVGAVQDAMTGMGASRGYAQDFSSKAGDLISMVPGAGNALSANDAYRSYQGGDYLGAALNGAMALPLPLATPEEDAARGIIAYHGSPYSFDKFDASKIGTGEGAQAYGHGLYFAENEDTARSYKPVDRAVVPDTYNADIRSNIDFALGSQGDLEGAKQRLQNNIGVMERNLANARDEQDRQTLTYGLYARKRALDALNSGEVGLEKQGHMYQVRINADPNQFLDWDKPLSEQSASAKNALQRTPWGDAYTNSQTLTGGQIVPKTAEGAQQLQQAGIPGIRYLDQGSRGAGDGTYNYVVFDPNTIDILKRYGLAGGLAGTGVGAAIMNPPAQAQPQL